MQELDLRLTALHGEIARIESELQGDDQLDRLRVEVVQAQADADAALANANAVDHEVSELTRHAKRLEGRLYGGGIGNPSELVMLQRELDTLREKLAVADGELLVVMESAEAADAAVRATEAAVQAREAYREASREPAEQHLIHTRDELGVIQTEREQLAAQIGASDMSLYTRVAGRHHPAVVRLGGDSCGGCHLPLGILEARAVRSGSELIQCSNCDRILAP